MIPGNLQVKPEPFLNVLKGKVPTWYVRKFVRIGSPEKNSSISESKENVFSSIYKQIMVFSEYPMGNEDLCPS